MKATVRPSSQIVTVLSKPPQMKTVLGTPGPAGPAGSSDLSKMSDVDVSALTDGSLLIYDSVGGKWVANTLLTAQFIECGEY